MKRLKGEKGQAMVETALVLSVLLLVIMGIFDFGWLLYHKIQIENCSREGARHGAVYYNVGDVASSDAEISNLIASIAPSGVPLNVSVKLQGDGIHKDNYIAVTVSGSVNVITPLMRPFFENGKCDMESTTISYREPAAKEKV